MHARIYAGGGGVYVHIHACYARRSECLYVRVNYNVPIAWYIAQ